MSLFTSALNAFSSQKAAKAQKRAADAALGLQKEQYQQARTDLSPYREAGSTALGQLGNLYGLNGAAAQQSGFDQFRADPGYQYAVDQGTQQVQGSAAARGMLQSGGTLKAIQSRAMNLADQGYNTYLGRLQGLAAGGQNAAVQTGQFGQNYANQGGQYYTDRGNANANSIMAPALGWRQFTQDVAKAGGAFAGGAFG